MFVLNKLSESESETVHIMHKGNLYRNMRTNIIHVFVAQ